MARIVVTCSLEVDHLGHLNLLHIILHVLRDLVTIEVLDTTPDRLPLSNVSLLGLLSLTLYIILLVLPFVILTLELIKNVRDYQACVHSEVRTISVYV